MSGVIFFSDESYPARLRLIPDPPEKLFYLGSWDPALFEKALSVVGSRKMTIYGKKVTQLLVKEVAAADITIISGFMTGIDTEAHKACLEAGGKTVAVMPCGVDVIHPEDNSLLYREIIEERGLIVSEFPDGHPPSKWTYPKRNRIVAGLACGVLVVEAALNSGSLITASFAKKYDRKVFAVPGGIHSENSLGTLELIKGGALPVSCSYDILRHFYKDAKRAKSKLGPGGTSDIQSQVLCMLSQNECSLDELAEQLSSISVQELNLILTELELQGLIINREGKYYAS